MASVWDSDEIKNAENSVRNQFVNSYNGQTSVDTNDQRLTDIERNRQQAINNSNNDYNNRINTQTQDYNNMINNAQSYYGNVNNVLQQGYEKQQQAMQAQTEANIQNINTQKERAQRDYQNEQRGSYVDYREAINPYGANAERMASQGLTGSGYSETYRSNAYNSWQNRVATAKQSLNDTLVNYDAQITNALNTNNTALAELWSNVASQMAQNSLQGFQYKNTLIEQRNQTLNSLTEAKNTNERQLMSMYDTEYQNMYNNMSSDLNRKISNYQWGQSYLSDIAKNRESSRQWESEQERQKQQWQAEYERQSKYYDQQIALSKAQLAETQRHNRATEAISRSSYSSKSSSTSSRLTGGSGSNRDKVVKLSSNMIGIKTSKGIATLTITPNATDAQINAWGKQHGISNLASYL